LGDYASAIFFLAAFIAAIIFLGNLHCCNYFFWAALIVATAFFPSLFSIGHHLAPLIVTATAIGCRQLPLETADRRWKPLTVAGNYRR